MVNIEKFFGGLVAVISYPFMAILLASVIDEQAPILGGLTRFLIFLVIPLMGIRILYVWAKGSGSKGNNFGR